MKANMLHRKGAILQQLQIDACNGDGKYITTVKYNPTLSSDPLLSFDLLLMVH